MTEPVARLTRRGEATIAARGDDGAIRQLHSLYDPWREARRECATLPGWCPAVVVFGLGGAFIPRHILSEHPEATVVVADRDRLVLAYITEHIDLSAELRSRRLVLVTSPQELTTALSEASLFTCSTEIPLFELRPWTEEPLHLNCFHEFRRTLQIFQNEREGELTTMKRFGVRWLVNTLRNSDRFVGGATRQHLVQLFNGTTFTLLGAGPAAEQNRERGAPVVATDTILPLLEQQKIVPRVVASLDPQCWSALHFRRGVPERSLLALDPATPAGVSSHGSHRSVIWVGSYHPLHQLLYTWGAPFYMLPQPARSVGEMAVLLVRSFGGKAELLGMDGTAPGGKTYARGTWHYSLARRRSSRTTPEEQFFASQVYPHMQPISSVGSAAPPGLEFSTTALLQRRDHLRRLNHAPELEQAILVPLARRFDPERFWQEHLGELDRVLARLQNIDVTCIPAHALRELLGPHGIAHLPAWHGLSRRRAPADCISFLYTALERVRAFVFSSLRRY